MGWSPSAIGIREAVTDAVKARMESKISDLVTCLSRDAWTDSLMGSAYNGGLTASDCVVRGDPEMDWDKAKGSVRIFVSAGAAKNGLSIEPVIEYIGQGEKKSTYHTFISVVLHTSTFAYRGPTDSTVQVQQTNREYALDRIQDWLNAVWNDVSYDPSSIELALTSTVLQGSGDKLKRVHAPMIFREVFMRGPADTVGMFGVHTVVTGIVSR